MKFKYYLRGVGVGIIFTTLILMIAFSKYKPKMSADEIRHEAGKLGMVMPEETATGNAIKEVVKNEKITDNKVTDEKEDKKDKKTTKEEKKIRFVVKGGEYSDKVSEHLADEGLVEDGEKYNKWLIRHGYDSQIQPGVYYIKKGSTKTEIIEALTQHE